MNKSWTAVEVDALRKAWQEGGKSAAMAALPGRSMHAIENKASSLGLKSRKPQWTTSEMRTLKRAMWEGGRYLAAQMLPGRTPEACGLKASEMGYKRRKGWAGGDVRRRALTEAQIDAAVVARRRGMSINRISKALCVSRPTVRRALDGIDPLGLRTV